MLEEKQCKASEHISKHLQTIHAREWHDVAEATSTCVHDQQILTTCGNASNLLGMEVMWATICCQLLLGK